jgi:hypothetical protein
MPLVQSSAVSRIDYTPDTGILDIWYKDAGLYSYLDVPETVYRALLAAPSKGRFINAHIKDHFAYKQPGRRKFRPQPG